VISTSIPRPLGQGPAEHGADLTVLHGGSLVGSERATATYFRYTIRLPRPLRVDESHELGVLLTIPVGQPFSQRYTLRPLRRCDEFDLRVRFGATGQAKQIWRIPGLPVGMAEEYAAPDALISPDAAGDIALSFQHLRVGLAYGARWSD
jgi:hypothetical protein